MKVMELKNITVDYGSGKGVFDLSFDVNKGEVVGFLGPNGAGKTTTIRQLMGFSRPDKGNCSILGMDCKKDAASIQRKVGYLPGEITFMDDMTGMQFINFVAQMKNMNDMGRAQELLAYFELDLEGKIKRMSKGMKQKVGIVCAFMQKPEILILDEPTSGLDPLMQSKFIDLIHEEKKKGTTILMSSHMFEEIERTCDRAVIIKAGRLTAVEDISALNEKKRKEFLVTFADAGQALDFAKAFGHGVKVKGKRASVIISGDIMEFIKTLAEYNVTGLESVTQNLEDIFMNYYGDQKEGRNGK